MLLLVTGCRVSDALTEVIYDQSSATIDYDNPTKILINDSTSDKETDQLAAQETSNDSSVYSNTVQNLVVYSSDPNTQGFTAKKSAFNDPPDFEGIEASEEVCFVETDDPNAFKHAPTIQEEEQPQEEEPEEQPEQIVASPTATSTTEKQLPATSTGKAKDKEGQTPEEEEEEPSDSGEGTEKPEGDDPQPEETEEQEGGNDDADVPVAYDTSDPTAEPPKVGKIAAFGPAATIVQMIGGKGALVATDADTLASSFSSVFDTSGIVAGWTGSGTSATTMDVDAIISSGANTVLVYAGNYLKNGLSNDDLDKLNKAGITQTVLYNMFSSGNIKQDVRAVGEMLSEATDIQYAGETMTRASDYVTFHDDVVSRAASANGGLAGSVMYQGTGDSNAPAFSSATPKYTLVIDAFEDSRYVGGTKNGWSPSSGLAFASAGYNSTPFSYYIQAGGLINNAADKTVKDDGGEAVAWQFHVNNFSFKNSQWVGAIAEVANAVTGYSLLTTTENLHGIYPFGKSFGSDAFPKVIVTSKDIETKLIANSADPNGTWHPYGFVSDGVFSMMGPASSIPSCIGFNGNDTSQTANLFASGRVTDDDIIVNPTGLFSDWTKGTPESFLEAAWVNDVAKGSSAIDWKGLTEQFYQKFYDYSLTATDWNTMNPEGA